MLNSKNILPSALAAMLLFHSASSLSASDSGYLLGAGDRISIQVYGEDDLSLDLLITESGTINYPFLGEIQVAGVRPQDLKKEIAAGLMDGYIRDPSVDVRLVEYRPIFINGEVNTPGGYPFQPGLTVSKATALAQGLTPLASDKKIFIVRSTAKGEEKIKAELSTELQPGDTVIIEQGLF